MCETFFRWLFADCLLLLFLSIIIIIFVLITFVVLGFNNMIHLCRTLENENKAR